MRGRYIRYARPKGSRCPIDTALRKPLLTKKEEALLVRRIEKGDVSACNEWVERNLRAVMSMVRHHKSQNVGAEMEDLFGAGIIGALEGIRKFDSNRNVKTLTYVMWWIREQITETIANEVTLVHVPRAKIHGAMRVRKAMEQFPRLSWSEAQSRVARVLGIPEEEVAALFEILSGALTVASLDEPLPGESKKTLEDSLRRRSGDQEQSIFEQQRRRAIARALKKLTPQQREVIIARFALNGGEEQTLQHIADRKRLSRERIRQVERDALKDLGCEFVAKHLRPFITD